MLVVHVTGGTVALVGVVRMGSEGRSGQAKASRIPGAVQFDKRSTHRGKAPGVRSSADEKMQPVVDEEGGEPQWR
jgi:hypothetical protein